MASNKMEQDFSETVDKAIPQAKEIAKSVRQWSQQTSPQDL
jgi:hypothetical protein